MLDRENAFLDSVQDFAVRTGSSSQEKRLRYVDLFAGLGGFHAGLSALGHECVFACEIDEELSALYQKNFGLKPVGDIRKVIATEVPPHDILCAGFPCQPFSLAGKKAGAECPKSGRLIEDVFRLVSHHKPQYVFLENVPNVLTIAQGVFWNEILTSFDRFGYEVQHRIYAPTEFGIPQPRKRLFVVANRKGTSCGALPFPPNLTVRSFTEIQEAFPVDAKRLEIEKEKVIEHWNTLVAKLPKLSSKTIIANEFGATYPLTGLPKNGAWRGHLGAFGESLSIASSRQEALLQLPHYVDEEGKVPQWMIQDIEYSRNLYMEMSAYLDKWKSRMIGQPNSWQKLQWRGHRHLKDIWAHTIQFRASGIRVIRPEIMPSLVAMTPTQIPIVGRQRRYISIKEAAALQSLEKLTELPENKAKAFKALGNAVNAKVVQELARGILN